MKGKVDLEYMSGKEIPADHLTKLGTVEEHREFARQIQGLQLLHYDYFMGKNDDDVAGK